MAGTYDAMRNISFPISGRLHGMADTAARLLRLLALLQSRADWTGPQLAERLGVTTRTIRKDVERLRALGYPVDAAPGAGGGYRLGAVAPAAAARRRGGGRGRDRAADGGRRRRLRARGGVGARAREARAGAPVASAPPGDGAARGDALVPGAAPAVDAEVLAALAAAVRARESASTTPARATPRGSARSSPSGSCTPTALAPRRLGPGRGGLVHPRGRDDPAERPPRNALRAARGPRRRPRGLRREDARAPILGVPRTGQGARASRPGRGARAARRRRRGGRRRELLRQRGRGRPPRASPSGWR